VRPLVLSSVEQRARRFGLKSAAPLGARAHTSAALPRYAVVTAANSGTGVRRIELGVSAGDATSGLERLAQQSVQVGLGDLERHDALTQTALQN
jgi:hypothetical protein